MSVFFPLRQILVYFLTISWFSYSYFILFLICPMFLSLLFSFLIMPHPAFLNFPLFPLPYHVFHYTDHPVSWFSYLSYHSSSVLHVLSLPVVGAQRTWEETPSHFQPSLLPLLHTPGICTLAWSSHVVQSNWAFHCHMDEEAPTLLPCWLCVTMGIILLPEHGGMHTGCVVAFGALTAFQCG